MSIEDNDSKKLEQQKLEQQETDKPKTGKDALDIVKAQKEGKDVTQNRETSTEQTKTGKEALDIVKAQKEGKDVTQNLETSTEQTKIGKEVETQEQRLAEAKPLGKLEHGEVRRTSEGSMIMCNEVGQATDRKGYEKMLFPATQVGLDGWHRAHSQGAGLGNEMKEGIRYAPPEVNLKLQNQGIEQHIRDIRDQLHPDAKLLLTTETKAHEGSLRLKSIDYKLEVEMNAERSRIYEASIEVENKRDNPKVTVSAESYTDDIERYLR
jgi:hypothetical protein